MKLTPQTEKSLRIQDYAAGPAIDGVEVIELRRFSDPAGSLTELARLDGGSVQGIDRFVAAQINYSTLEPGGIKGMHLHRRQTDLWYVPPHDRILLVLADVREASASVGVCLRLVLGDGRSRLVRVPPGVAHGCRNIGTSTARVVYFTDLQFSTEPGSCDEGRLAWDHFGSEVWELPRD